MGSNSKRIHGQKGAALVTVMILLFLMLAVSGTIVYVTVLSNTSTVDLVAEKQAYDAAEAGMQLTLNILRGNNPGNALSFKDAAVRTTSNKADDWYPGSRLSKWLNYTYPTAQPDRVPLTSPYDPYTGLAFSVEIVPPDYAPNLVPTPNPDWIDGPVVKPNPPVKPAKPAWHPWHCAHCSWDYTHCSLYNPPNNGTRRSDGYGCRHKHCIPPPGWGQAAGDAYQRLIVRVTGYGPRGARQQLELLVKKEMLSFDDHSMFLIRGSNFGGDMTFNVGGTPKVVFNSGDKMTAFGLTSNADQTIVQNTIADASKVTIDGKGDDYEVLNAEDIPGWLSSADAARKMVRDLELDAKYRNRWFTSYPTGSGGTDSAPELTFVRGNATITSDGAGILIVTGELSITTDKKFKGLILLLEGGTLKITSGKATFEGGVVMARFGATGDFLGPVLNFNGTPEVEFRYHEGRIANALKTINMHVQAVREN